jgi:hypothetical protein
MYNYIRTTHCVRVSTIVTEKSSFLNAEDATGSSLCTKVSKGRSIITVWEGKVSTYSIYMINQNITSDQSG